MNNQSYISPPEIVAAARARINISQRTEASTDLRQARGGRFDLDPCASDIAGAPEHAHRNIRKPEDGLTAPWPEGDVWLNPPYARILPWVNRAAEHVESGRGNLAALLPADQGTRWAVRLRQLAKLARVRVYFLGRVSFLRVVDGRTVADRAPRHESALYLVDRDRGEGDLPWAKKPEISYGLMGCFK